MRFSARPGLCSNTTYSRMDFDLEDLLPTSENASREALSSSEENDIEGTSCDALKINHPELVEVLDRVNLLMADV